jgi:DNA-binding response OmpR family regulator
MVKKISLLLYEKETKLNLILKEQLLKTRIYEVYTVINLTKIKGLLQSLKPDILILNLNKPNTELNEIIKNFKINDKNINIIGYYNDKYPHLTINNIDIKILKQPFRLITLLNELRKIQDFKFLVKKDISLMYHIKFIPNERVLLNLKTKNKEHLTEKENELLFYFCTHKNVEIKRNEILNTIWGFSDSINTHTLETHIYRLKLKIDKLEPDLSFSLSNQKGFYTMKFNKII